MGEAVLIEVWLDLDALGAYAGGVPCRRVALHGREDGTFELGLSTSFAELAAAGVRAVFDGPGDVRG